jgi:hypothetical protein
MHVGFGVMMRGSDPFRQVAEAGADKMLVACRLAGLYALVFDYAVDGSGAQSGGLSILASD